MGRTAKAPAGWLSRVSDVNDATGPSGEPDFIVPPPGLLPAAPAEPPATTRRPRSRPVERALPAFAPVTNAMPVPGVPIASPATGGPTGAGTGAATTNGTQRPAPASQGWVLTAEGPVEYAIDGRVLLGRAPDLAASPAADVHGIVVHDPARTVSKTHALVQPDDGVLLVTDLHSTNGVRVARADGTEVEVPAGGTVDVSAGDVIVLGEFPLRVSGR